MSSMFDDDEVSEPPHEPEAAASAENAANSQWRGPQVKLNKFGGSRPEYRGWRDEVQALLLLHGVPEDK